MQEGWPGAARLEWHGTGGGICGLKEHSEGRVGWTSLPCAC